MSPRRCWTRLDGEGFAAARLAPRRDGGFTLSGTAALHEDGAPAYAAPALGFEAVLTVDADGAVVADPGLFRRVAP